MSAASGKTLAHREDGGRDLNGIFGSSVALVFRKSGEPPARRLQ
jgi:hypothetical protein